MRVTSIEDSSLAGMTYKEVVDRLKAASRPVRIKFADVVKGTVEEQAERESKEQRDSERLSRGSSSVYLEQKREFTRVLVTGELHTEMWTIENKKLLRDMVTMKTKWNVLSSAFDVLNARRMELRKENDVLKSDKTKFETMLKNLKLQESFVIENPELVRANELAKRNAELTEDINKMSAGNKRLRKERVTLQTSQDGLESQLSKVEKSTTEEEDKAADEEFFGFDPNASAADHLSMVKKKRRGIEDELAKEQRKASKVLKEMEQLNKHYASLTDSSKKLSSSQSSSTSGSSSSAGRSSKEDKNSLSSSGSGKPPSEIADLEAKILELRKKQRSVVDTLSKAAQSGDHKLAKECQRKRQQVKEELKNAQDQLHLLKTQGTVPAAGSSKSSDAPQTTSRSRNVSTSSASGTSQSKERTMSSRKQSTAEKPKKIDKMPTLYGFLDKGPTEWSDGRGLFSNIKTKRGARERWCEITNDGVLKYYKRRGDSEVRGEINLSDPSFEVVCEDMKRGKEFILSTDSQQSHFFTKDTEELLTWVTALRGAQSFLKAKQQKQKEAAQAKQKAAKQKDHLNALARKAEQSESEMRGGNFTLMGMGDSNDDDEFPEEDSQYYGRATLGF